MKIKEIAAIDIHSHFNSGSPDDRNESATARVNMQFQQDEYAAANICCGGFSSFAAVCFTNGILDENKKAHHLAETLPWFFQWVVVDPRDLQTFAQAKQMLRSPKCLGIKIHPSMHQYPLQAFGDVLFRFAAEQGTTILTHPDLDVLSVVPELANRYQDCRVILAHVGTDFEDAPGFAEPGDCLHFEAMDKARYGNVYTDTSGNASIRNNTIEYAVSRVGADRILFGTDTYSCGAQRGRIEYARIPDGDKVAILRGNALRLFPNLANFQ